MDKKLITNFKPTNRDGMSSTNFNPTFSAGMSSTNFNPTFSAGMSSTNFAPPASSGMASIYRMSDAPPNWSQDDPSQPDYIKNKDEAEKLRPIYVNGEQMLNDTHESGPLNLVSGRNVELAVEGNSVIISAKGGGGEGPGGGCDCPEIVEGDGIDVVETPYGQKVVSLEKGAITDEYISSISIDKLVQTQGVALILNGGNANGEYN